MLSPLYHYHHHRVVTISMIVIIILHQHAHRHHHPSSSPSDHDPDIAASTLPRRQKETGGNIHKGCSFIVTITGSDPSCSGKGSFNLAVDAIRRSDQSRNLPWRKVLSLGLSVLELRIWFWSGWAEGLRI